MSSSNLKARRRIASIQRRIAQIDLIASGTLLERTKTCGKPSCRCLTEPAARHGPYWEWNRRIDNHLCHRTVSPEEAREILRAMDDYQLLLALLADWEEETERILLGPDRVRLRKDKR